MAPPVTFEKPASRFNLGDTRFYEQRFPDKEELVMVKVSRVAEMGAYVSLLEYSGLEGMILMSELSKRRIRSVNKIVRVGRHEVVLVLRVDKEKGYIDLSKKRVSPEDVVRCEERFCKSKKVHQIMYHIAQKHEMSLEELNKKITWPLHKKFGHALDAFRNLEFPTSIADTLELAPAVKETLIEVVKLRLAAHAMRMRCRVDVHCYGPDGVEAVREALIKGKETASSRNAEVKVKLIAPPQYTLITTCSDKADGETRLSAAVESMIQTIRKYKGGDAAREGEFTMIGGEDQDRRLDELDESDSDSDSGSEESEEDEGMGRVDEDDLILDEEEEANDDEDDTKNQKASSSLK